MLDYYQGDVYLSNQTIIYNPVGVRDNTKGFITRLKYLYPMVYNQYHDMVWSYNVRELLGEVQLVQVDSRRLIMNGYCKEKNGHINKLYFTKTLVELCNLAYEYQLSVGIEYALGIRESIERQWLVAITEEVFRGVDDIDVKVFDRQNKF